MAIERKRKPGAGAPAPVGAPADCRGEKCVAAAWVLLGAYAILFFMAPLSELAGYSRAQFLGNQVLLLDQVVQEWFGDPPEFAILDRLWVALPAAAMLAVCGLVGWLVLLRFHADRGMARLDVVFFSCTLGLGLMSLYTFAVGLCGGLHARWLFLAPPVAVVVIALYSLVRRAPRKDKKTAGKTEPRTTTHMRASREDSADRVSAGRWLWWAAPFVAAIVLGGTLTPLDFDVREYHLQAPKEFFLDGSIGFLPHNVYGNMPLGSEMLSLAAMTAVGDWWHGALIGKTVIALCGPLAALGVFAAGRRLIGAMAGVVAALVYISIPWIARVSELGLVEGVSALYLWGTVYALLLWWRGAHDEKLPRVLLAGFMAGSAAACKYPNVVFVLIPAAAVVALRSWRTRPEQASGEDIDKRQAATGKPATAALRPARYMPIVGFLFAAAVACGPWFAKNWILTGNPTYPLLYGLFDGRTRTPELHAQWRRAHRPPGYGLSYVADSVANLAWRSSWLSPLLLPLAVLGAIGARDRRLALSLSIYAAFVLAAWWLFTHRIDRFWIPISPVLAFLAGYVVEPHALLPWRWPFKTYLAAGLSACLLVLVAIGAQDNAFFVSLDRLNQDRLRIHVWHQLLNRNLNEHDVVLAVGDAVVFDLRVPVLYNTVFDQDRFEQLMKGRTAAEQRQVLHDRGVTYVAVDWAEIARYRSPGNYGFTDYEQPELFEELVREHVLDPPVRVEGVPESSVKYQIFPVSGASTAAQSWSLPP